MLGQLDPHIFDLLLEITQSGTVLALFVKSILLGFGHVVLQIFPALLDLVLVQPNLHLRLGAAVLPQYIEVILPFANQFQKWPKFYEVGVCLLHC